MLNSKCVFSAVVLFLCLLPAALSAEPGAKAGSHPIDLAQAIGEATPEAQVERDGAAWRVRVSRSSGRPGITFTPPGAAWDLTGMGYVEARVKNLGKGALSVHLSLDNPGADRTERKGCCIGSTTIPPGAEQTLKVTVSARPPKDLEAALRGMRGTPGGFQTRQGQGIDPANVVAISVYVYQPGGKCEYTVSELRAGGSPVFLLPKNLDDLFPMIDRFGQYIHKDWPGKTHGEDDLAAARKQEAADLAAHPGPQAWNQYGGWLAGPKLEATGRFRVAKRDKWWFVDPEGRLFWSHGLVRVTWSCGYTPITGRERLFAELAERDSAIRRLLRPQHLGDRGALRASAETYNFSGQPAAEVRPQLADGLRRPRAPQAAKLGLNTMANCSQPAIYLERKTPYTATVYSLDSPPEDTPAQPATWRRSTTTAASSRRPAAVGANFPTSSIRASRPSSSRRSPSTRARPSATHGAWATFPETS